MSRTVSAATVIQRIRQRGEIRASNLSDAVLLTWVNDSLTTLWDLITHSNNTFFSTVEEFTQAQNAETYDLPEDFYKEKMLCRQEDNQPLGRYEMPATGLSEGPFSDNYRFTILGQKLYFSPVPRETLALRLFYIQAAPFFEDEDDLIDGQNGWEEFIVLDVLAKNAVLEQSVRTMIDSQLDTCTRRIIDNASDRISSDPPMVRNVLRENRRRSWWFGG